MERALLRNVRFEGKKVRVYIGNKLFLHDTKMFYN
jgi:hypothetical protein